MMLSMNGLYNSLKIDCTRCFGFCCVALYFSASEGFPTNKEAGSPCPNLKEEFTCAVHKDLRVKGLKGCTAYDCFGAGQKVAQGTYRGQDWRQVSQSAKQMFEVFLIMKQLHEMLWYLKEALLQEAARPIKEELINMISETEQLTRLSADTLMKLDVVTHQDRVNILLRKTSELVRAKACGGQRHTLKRHKTIAGRLDFIGADLKKMDLRGADLRGAFLIAADLRGVDLSGADLIASDMRDADLRGANLTNSIFITQAQINTAKGDANTKLPKSLTRPSHWER